MVENLRPEKLILAADAEQGKAGGCSLADPWLTLVDALCSRQQLPTHAPSTSIMPVVVGGLGIEFRAGCLGVKVVLRGRAGGIP